MFAGDDDIDFPGAIGHRGLDFGQLGGVRRQAGGETGGDGSNGMPVPSSASTAVETKR